jgi:hypothetical protein
MTEKNQARDDIHARAKELDAAGVKLGEPAGPVAYREPIDAYVGNYASGVLAGQRKERSYGRRRRRRAG